MAEKQILFNTEMVKAILDGRKTQTRRVVDGIPLYAPYFEVIDGEPFQCDENGDWHSLDEFCPYQPGDTMWVRETWAETDSGYKYRADCIQNDKGVKWNPSIHMPHEAVRLFLRVKSVRVERVQDITPDDVRASGVESLSDFPAMWDRTISKPKLKRCGWNANPWVFAIEFERIKLPTKQTRR